MEVFLRHPEALVCFLYIVAPFNECSALQEARRFNKSAEAGATNIAVPVCTAHPAL